MKIVILSVPHTGTNFTKRLFRDLGWEDVALNAEPLDNDNAFYVGHIRHDDLLNRAKWLAVKYPLICPFRHPFRCEESWRRRKKPRPISEMIEGYKIMMDSFIPMDPYIMPVDSPLRKDCLKVMSKGLLVKLQTDWSVVGTMGTHDLKLEDCIPSDPVIKLADEMQDFLQQYYPHQESTNGYTRKKIKRRA